MKIMNCPLNGPRNISEFLCAGEVVEMPDPGGTNPAEWADYVFGEANPRDVVREWWFHVPTGYWFIAERDTARDEILKTYAPGEVFRRKRSFRAPSKSK